MSIQNPVLYNCAAAGMIAGVLARRLPTLLDAGEESEPVDFSALVTAAFVFATEIDDLINAIESPPTNLTLLSANVDEEIETIVPSNAAEANAAESLPQALTFIVRAAWSGRGVPTLLDGVPFAPSDYQPVANAVVSAFVEFCSNCEIV